MDQERMDELGRQGQAKQAAADERRAVERANQRGLTGKAAEQFKAQLISGWQDGRAAVRAHVEAVLESPEAQGRSRTAAIEIALDPNLSTDQAIAKLEDLPADIDDAEAAARFILDA